MTTEQVDPTTPTALTRVSCLQLAPTLLDLDANCAAIVAEVSRAVAAGTDVIVLPELATSGYVFASLEEGLSVAITPDHAVFTRCAAALRGTSAVAVFGFAEVGDDGLLYNSAAVVTADGVVCVYRKTHLWDAEKLYFTPGSERPPVIDTAVGRLGLMICYDLEFPEMPRLLAVDGADLIVVPVNWPFFPRPAGERSAENVIAMAAARVNRVFIAVCDRAGTERGQEWTQGTAVMDPEGWVVGVPDESGLVTVDLELARARDKHVSPRNDVLADRRQELYPTPSTL